MEILTLTSDEIELRLTGDEAVLINNALNEVGNGVNFSDGELHARLGSSRAEVRALLEGVNEAIKAMKRGDRWPKAADV